MALTRSALRQRVASAIGALSGYSEGRSTPGTSFRDPNERRHGAFVVEIGPSTPNAHQRSGGVHLVTEVRVSVALKVQPKNQVASYDAGLDAQEAVAVAVLGMSLADVQITLSSFSAPFVEPDGSWMRIDLSFSAVHLCAVV